MEVLIVSIVLILVILIILAFNKSKAKFDTTKKTFENLNCDREVGLMQELDLLIEKGDKIDVQKWLDNYYNSGNKVTGKVYSRAKAFIEDKKWLTDEEYKKELEVSIAKNNEKYEKYVKEQEQSIMVSQIVKNVIDIILNIEMSKDEMAEKIRILLEPYTEQVDFINGIKKHAYWHAMHIIMNSNKVPVKIATKARSDRQKNMTAFTTRKLSEFPIFVITDYLIDNKIYLSSADCTEYQNFAFINSKRDF